MTQYDANAHYINGADEVDSRLAEGRKRDMVGKSMARWFIACGCFAAVIGSLGTLAFAASVGGLGALNIVLAVVMLGLAYGIFRANRICAVLALVIYLAQRITLYSSALALQSLRGGDVMTGFWTSVAIFSALYILGVIGAFAWQGESAAPLQWNPAPAAKPAVQRKAQEKLARAREFCAACSGSGKTPGSDATCAWCDGAGFV